MCIFSILKLSGMKKNGMRQSCNIKIYSDFLFFCLIAQAECFTTDCYYNMARRIAINLGQRIAFSNNGRNKERGRSHNTPHTEDKNHNLRIPKKDSAETSKEQSNEAQITTDADINTNKRKRESEEDTMEPRQEKKTKIEAEVMVLNTGESDSLETKLLESMGFKSFSSTKNQHVKGTDCYGIYFKQRTEYRQYMNREGGFNRSLSPTRTDRKKIKLSLKKE